VDNGFVSQCGEVIRDRARGPLSDGRATLNRIEHENGDWFELTPANERACPVSVTPNGPGDGELAIGLGRNDAWFEAWGSPDETINVLQKTIDAAIAGEYEEFHKGKRHIGRLSFPDGSFRFSGNTFARFPPRFGNWTRATYDPY
jgi:hypothetical protein